MPQSNNLLVALSRWASGQQENFLSDAFVHLLNLLAQQVPDAFVLIVERMTGGSLAPAPDTTADFTVTSQVSTSEGTPDVEIVGPRCYALIEVKVSRAVVYRRREDDEPFRLLWDEATHEALELLEAEARLRAMSGSDTLLIFLLKAHDAKYRFAENSRLELPGDSQAVKGFELRVVYDTPWAPPSDGEEPADE